jgi:lauroyl/myristoyl acyltransferase
MKWMTMEDLYHGAVICLIQALAVIGAPGLVHVAACLAGGAAFHLSRDKRDRLEAALNRWRGSSLGTRERRRLGQGVFIEAWRELLFASEVERAVTRPSTAEVLGLEHLRSALAAGKGVILWESSAFGLRLFSKAALKSHGYEVIQFHGAENLGGMFVRSATSSVVCERVIRPFFDEKELSAVSRIVQLRHDNALAHLRTLIEHLRQNAAICMTADGRSGQRFVTRRFLNHALPFATGAVSLSRLTGAPLVPMFCYRSAAARPVLVLEPPIDLPPGASRDEEVEYAMQRFVDLLTSYVERYPTQYRTWHTLDIESRAAR